MTFMAALPTRKLFVVLSCAEFKNLIDRTYVNVMQKVAVSLSAINSGTLLTTLANIGFISDAPKYRVPTTVVKQSIEPMNTSSKLGSTAVLG